MENQHRKIKGYRELSQDEIDMMNRVKEAGGMLSDLISYIESYSAQIGSHVIDMRWLNIGKTDLQKGIMAITRAIAKPDFF